MSSLLLLNSILIANAYQNGKTKTKMKKKIKSNKTNKTGIMCRICNEERGIIPIFNNLMHPNIPRDVQNISGVILTESDSVSKYMCKSCLDLLNGCILFREMCQRTNEIIAVAIKKEDKSQNGQNKERKESDSEDCFNIPSPALSEDNSQLWNCSTCGKDFRDMATYYNHLKNCVVPIPVKKPEVTKRKFLCDICGKTAYSNASLLAHKSTHTNIFPFKCDQCPYQGRSSELLKVHRRTHLTDKPFKCPQCTKTTSTASNLTKHMRNMHVPRDNRPYMCTYCKKAFRYQHNVRTHIRDVHLRQGIVDCDICHKKFNTKKILRSHQWKVHKIKGERQGRLPSYLQCQEPQDKVN